MFCNDIACCRSTDYFLSERGYKTANYHSGIPAAKRAENFQLFDSGSHPILVCTDIASRGLDYNGVRPLPPHRIECGNFFFQEVSHVILFDFPFNPIDYLHRIGRTGRAGKSGTVTCLLKKGDLVLANAIEVSL